MVEFIKSKEDRGNIIDPLHTATAHEDNVIPIEVGGERYWGRGKVFSDLTIHRDERTRYAGRYVIKAFPIKRLALEELRKVLDLEKAGVPVPPTHRYTYDPEANKFLILYTDLSDGGRHEVWSVNDPVSHVVHMDISMSEFNTLREQTAAIADKASDAGYKLCFDSYFLRRKDTGELDVVIGDLGYGITKSDTSVEDLKKENGLNLDLVLNVISTANV